MVKAGLISGAVMLVLVLIAGFIAPLCALCVPLLVGILAGYLNGTFEKAPETAVQRGAMAGAIAGGMGILGNICAGIINASVLQNADNQVVNEMLNLPPSDPAMVWAGQLIAALCIGVLNVALSAGLGAAGGAIWKSTAGKTPPAEPMAPAPM